VDVQVATDEASLERYRALGYRFENTPVAFRAATGHAVLLGRLRACDIADPLRRAPAWTHAVVAVLVTDTRTDDGLMAAGFEAVPVDLSAADDTSQPRYLWLRRAGRSRGGEAGGDDGDGGAGGAEAEAARVEAEAGPLLDVWVGPAGERPTAPGFRPLSCPVTPLACGPQALLWTRSLALADDADEDDDADVTDGGQSRPVMRDAAFACVALPPMPARTLVPPSFIRRRAAARARAQCLAALAVRERASRFAETVEADAEAAMVSGGVGADAGVSPARRRPLRAAARHGRRQSDSSFGSVVRLADGDDVTSLAPPRRAGGLAAEADAEKLFLALLHTAADAGAPGPGTDAGLGAAGGSRADDAPTALASAAGFPPSSVPRARSGFASPAGPGGFVTPRGHGIAGSSRRSHIVRLPTFMANAFEAGDGPAAGPATPARLREAARTPVAGIHAAIAAAGSTLSRAGLLAALEAGPLGLALSVRRQRHRCPLPPRVCRATCPPPPRPRGCCQDRWARLKP